jgi:hypothetical protein
MGHQQQSLLVHLCDDADRSGFIVRRQNGFGEGYPEPGSTVHPFTQLAVRRPPIDEAPRSRCVMASTPSIRFGIGIGTSDPGQVARFCPLLLFRVMQRTTALPQAVV